jgi:hypothetical protein
MSYKDTQDMGRESKAGLQREREVDSSGDSIPRDNLTVSSSSSSHHIIIMYVGTFLFRQVKLSSIKVECLRHFHSLLGISDLLKISSICWRVPVFTNRIGQDLTINKSVQLPSSLFSTLENSMKSTLPHLLLRSIDEASYTFNYIPMHWI